MDRDISTARIGDIRVGHNPRKYFDPKEHAALVDSIRAKSLLTPILVRPMDGGFELVAGERRLRACREVYGEDGEIPVLCKEMTDAEALIAATIENVQRADMSPTEESAAATQVLAAHNGDRAEVAKWLGWSPSKLESRLALQNCTPEVQDALNQRSISLGHAELLAAVVKKIQNQILPIVIDKGITVADLKAELAKQALDLSTATFDKAECAGCQFNSSNQKALFADAIDEGRCTQKSCYDAKHEALIAEKVKSFEGQYQTIKVVRPGDNATVIKLKADTTTGVGAEQAEACKGCANYGVAISAVPGKVGLSFEGFCFETACHTKHNAAYLEQLKAETKAQNAVVAGENSTETKQGSKTGTAKAAGSKTARPAVSAESSKVKEYREAVWRAVLKKVILRSPGKTETILVALAASGLLRHVNDPAIKEQVKKASTSQDADTQGLGPVLEVVAALEETPRERILDMVGASVAEKIEMRDVKAFASFLQIDLASHWQVCTGLLETMTKAEIEAVATEIGLKASLDKKFPKVMSLKRDEMIKGLLGAQGFDFRGKVPAMMALK